jgi:general secretion pathway protein K
MIVHFSARREAGAALITAVLVTALVTVTAVTMAKRQQLDIRRSDYLFSTDQAYLYALGAEAWGQRILARDFKDGKGDHLGEDWAQAIPPLPIEGGQLQGRIEDLQGRLNLNNLLDGEQPDELAVQRFDRLLRLLNLDPALTTALLDWLDKDQEPRRPDGVEDLDYLSAVPAYRAANAPLVSVGELRAVKGFDEAVLVALRPYVTALPQRTAINVNTAPVEVLMSLADNIARADAESLAAAREDDGFPGLGDFLVRDEVAGTGIVETGLALDSSYFMLHSLVLINDRPMQLYSLVYRDRKGEPRVLMHSNLEL